MTAPTSDRAQRVDAIAKAIQLYRQTVTNTYYLGPQTADVSLARTIVDTLAPDTERLGGGGREVPPDTSIQFQAWSRVVDALSAIDGNWSVGGAAIDRAPAFIRTLAQTAKDATARAEAAEAANMELDNARKSAEQSARDLRAENTQLRAQLDAMTGEQVPVIDVFCKNNVCMFGSSTFPSTLPDGVHTLYRHPTPAARVVGACVVRDNDVVAYYTWHGYARADHERHALERAEKHSGTAHTLLLGPALTPNADGQTARVDEVSDTANGLRHVARGPKHKSTPNADGAK